MKKTLLVVALVAIMLFAFANTALAKNAGSAAAAGDGYVSWPTALSIASAQAAQAAGPHSNYTVSTVKCAVCHSMHGAPDNTFLLTKVTANSGATNAGYVCAYCHGYGATAGAMIVAINQVSATPDNTNAPHSSYCYTKCHAGVHGVHVSSYSMMAAKLLRDGADTMIAAAVADPGTGLTNADFTAPVAGFGFNGKNVPVTQAGLAASTYPALAMSTGYLCGQPGCHTQSAFAVKTRGDHMKVQSRGAIKNGTLALSGHPVIADARTNWVAPSGSALGTATVGVDTVTSIQVAFKPTAGCPTCHDLPDAGTTLGFAFPHNRGASNIWLTKAEDALGTNSSIVQNSDVIDSSTGTVIGLADNYTTVQDGICLKCHRSGTGSGVGQTF